MSETLQDKDSVLLLSKLLPEDQLYELAMEAIGKFTETKDKQFLDLFIIYNRELFNRTYDFP